MDRLRVGLVAVLYLILGAVPALAQLGGGQPHIRAQLVAESMAPAAGATTTLAIRWTPQPGWHGYWKNPGNSGLETEAHWTLPKGVSAGPLAYPVPTTLMIAGLMNHVYEAPYAHLVRLTVPKGLARGSALPVRVKLDWLECTEQICVPATTSLAIDLKVGDGTPDASARAAFDGWRAAMPRPLDQQVRYAVAGGNFRMAVPLPASMRVATPHFFALTDGAVDYAAPQRITRNGDMLVIATKAAGAVNGPVEGVLRIGNGQGLQFRAVPGAVPADGTPVAANGASDEQGGSGPGGGTFLLALGGALLGGLLLNIMPCVFPILSLKALSLARAGDDSHAPRREAVAYTAGVVLVCLALGGVLLGLRAAGSAAGWAFQLQDPRVILFLLVLVTAIALNLAGLFELAVIAGGDSLAAQGGTKGAFWTGALAAFVATPCTGPFMAGALGAALVLPPAAALAVFGGLGLGLALPFLLLGFVPAFRRMLPRPGAWMDRFRHILAIPMFLTALGLAWILGRQAGVDGMVIGLAAALAIGLGLWAYGRRQATGRGRGWLALAPAAIVAAAAIGFVPQSVLPAQAAAATDALASEPFSENRLAALQAEGRPVFVYFTADWCLTCKVNEKAAIERAETAEAFHKGKVAVLVGDWTRGDAAIGRFIEAQGRSGVPLYLWYAPGKPAEILPQVLTSGLLAARASS
ncbi:protein-disulfide reductase DsbD family protein [Sphingomonas quercus]|uniref:Thioredoxin family protein n=1 Tax=Sphingomonas quercus TaxID=2842451 RepID=A0ABS6BJG8_9SPHN|nr:protein-disulfide reductase DsbD domain-containing protein [Sphingomonas quercus]MBU3078448.1 thioredoxin family protein [Sphingomonas quercus]